MCVAPPCIAAKISFAKFLSQPQPKTKQRNLGAEISEGDERRIFFNIQSPAGSLNGPDNLTKLPFPWIIPYQSLHSLNALPSFSEKGALEFTDSLLRRIP